MWPRYSPFTKIRLPFHHFEFLPVFNRLGGSNINEKIRIRLATALFLEREITLARAAELAGTSLAAYMDLLNQKGIPWSEYTQETYEQDLAFLERRKQEKSNE